jgi:hypothetical protein
MEFRPNLTMDRSSTSWTALPTTLYPLRHCGLKSHLLRRYSFLTNHFHLGNLSSGYLPIVRSRISQPNWVRCLALLEQRLLSWSMGNLLLDWRASVCFISKGLLLTEAVTRVFASIFIQYPLEGEHGNGKKRKWP